MTFPQFYSRIARHAELFEKMTEKLGASEQLATLPGAGGVRKRAADRCLSCTKAEQCASWLDLQPAAENAPDFCQNQDLFARLKTAKAAG